MVNVDQDLFYTNFLSLIRLEVVVKTKTGTFNGYLRDIDGLDFHLHRYG